MHQTPRKLHRAQVEVHETAHSQDMVEVSKRAKLDRESENHEIHLPRTKRGENRIEAEL
jgi:hypothetical protein